jgi:hypothetical protein
MSAVILKFPHRGPFAVRVVPEADGGWLIIARSPSGAETETPLFVMPMKSLSASA